MTSHLTLLPSYNLLFVTTPQPRFSQFRPRHGRSLLAAVSASKTSVAARKQTKTNADLCNDLREFVSEVGLPDGHVPSLKELSQHGRQDLANIVRRRGYKFIRELLAASEEIKVSDSDVDGSLTENEATTAEVEFTVSQEIIVSESHVEGSLTEDEANASEDELTASQEIKVSDSHVEGSLTEVEASKAEDELTGLDENRKELTGYMLPPHEDMLGEGSTKASLQEKVAKFIQSGELEEIEGCDQPSSQVLSESESASLENGSILTSQLVNSTSQLSNITSNDQVASDEAANTDKDLEAEIITEEDQAEINRIKVMLHTKELELSRLKEQIEKNKQALSELQAKAETEINKAQQLLLDKDAELVAAEESLSGLKQVQMEYWGEGETVQVAGSFNGWHHGVTLDPQPSSNITDPVELRNTRLWRSMLWLYPGIYEIKFIVDGKWMIDPMKEVVTRGSIQNNVLRVDR
ncbi:protein PTST homolog 3, chloroplastic [Bidens hawaiensis]|uniref:protein PTST homolog 3, chloroplastic n=1 Tax=Bidens hawaiensis TaxID=980011 RepID=UPI00404A49DD